MQKAGRAQGNKEVMGVGLEAAGWGTEARDPSAQINGETPGDREEPRESPHTGDFSLVTAVREQMGLFLNPADHED